MLHAMIMVTTTPVIKRIAHYLQLT